MISLSPRRLLNILNAIREYLPNVTRVASYCSPRNVSNKSDADLKALYDAGLKLVYVGAESGDDFVLKSINKGDTHDSVVDSLNRLADAGIKRSVMIINGAGGTRFSEQHALNSALLANKTQPEFLATLVLNLRTVKIVTRRDMRDNSSGCRNMSVLRKYGNSLNALELKSDYFQKRSRVQPAGSSWCPEQGQGKTVKTDRYGN